VVSGFGGEIRWPSPPTLGLMVVAPKANSPVRPRTRLLVEQNVRAGLELATHGVVMESGRIRLTGSGAEVLAHPEMSALYLGGTTQTADASVPGAVTGPGEQDCSGTTASSPPPASRPPSS
jgi:hypothetical protein